MLWPLLGGASFWFIAAALCVVHLIVTRRDPLWMLVLLALPLIGSLIYLLYEVLPRLRAAGAGERALELPFLARLRLGRLERNVRFSDTVENRVALAEAYLERGQPERALELYRPVLNGPFRSNPHLQYGYARACHAAGDDLQAIAVLEAAEPLPSTAKRRERWPLMAQSLERLGRMSEAEVWYQRALPGFPGEEVKARYADYLLAAGRREEGQALFAKIITSSQNSDRGYRRQERVWIRLARQRLAELARPGAPPPPAPASTAPSSPTSL